MSKLYMNLLIGLLIVIGGMLSFSCAKKTTAPDSSGDNFDDFLAQLANCEWQIYIQPEEHPNDFLDGETWIVVDALPKTPYSGGLPTVIFKINDDVCEQDWWYDEYDESGYYSWWFIYPTELIPGESYDLSLIIDGNSTRTSLEIPYIPTLTEPEIFIHSQATLFKWTLSKSANIQSVFKGWQPSEEGENYQGELIVNSVRQYIMPAGTVPSNWTRFGFGIINISYKIIEKVGFFSLKMGVRSYYPANSTSHKVAEIDTLKPTTVYRVNDMLNSKEQKK